MIFSKKIQDLAFEAESALTAQYKHIDEVAFLNTQKVMDAFAFCFLWKVNPEMMRFVGQYRIN